MSVDTSLVLLAAGAGTRLGAALPKALVPLGGRPLFLWPLARLARTPGVKEVVIVSPPPPHQERLESALADARAAAGAGEDPIPEDVTLRFVGGGARRRDSVRAGLEASRGKHVLVHDAARALASAELAARVLEAARREGAAVPALPVADALVRGEAGSVGEEVERAGLFAVQTPQGFVRDLLVEAHEVADPGWDARDDGTMVRALGRPVLLVAGEAENLKLTFAADRARMEQLLAGGPREGEAPVDETTRVGIGFDVHPMVEGRPTLIAGVELLAERGPGGHSDGDPLSHALVDALLGAAGLGDIGQHFPDTDPRFAGAPGLTLLEGARQLLAAAGWAPANVDAVLVCDSPKIGPAREAIRAALAGVLGLPSERVNVKGKRTEGLGGLAGGAGIACHAVATLRRLPPGAP